MSTQYTLRTVPDAIDQAIRKRASLEARSINSVALEALGRGLEMDESGVEYTDLDALIGSWQEDPDFDEAVADFGRVDEDAWK
ncbi:MAG TPA: hypothetical protein VF585_02825 [Chthoniobacterales bacterium]|jgi:hypothetical protein